MTVSIIIPTRNEQDNIRPMLERIAAVSFPDTVDREIIFVDDQSTDLTRSEIRSYRGPLPVRLICRDNETGLSSAVCAGARAARGDLVVVMDADLSHPPEAIPAMLEPLLDGSREMVIGSRYAKGGSTPEWPVSRKVASRLATLPARLFTSVHDPLAGFFAIRKEFILAVAQPAAGFKIALQILATAGPALRVAEIPITFVDRTSGSSKMNSSVIAAYLRQIAGLSGLATEPLGTFEPLLLGGLVLMFDLFFFQLFQEEGLLIDASHIISFLLSCGIGYVLTAATSYHSEQRFRLSALFRYLFVLILFLFVRGGVLALIIDRFPDSPVATALSVTIVAVIAATSGYLFATGQTERRHSLNWRATALLIVSYTFLLRLLYLGSYELIQEEAYYWNYSQHLALGYLDHPPMVALLIWFGTHLFGPSEFGVRIGAFGCWLLTACFGYRLAASVFDRQTALNALMLLSVLPFFFGTAIVITPDAPLVACWAGTLYYLHQSLIKGKAWSWLGAGIFFGLGLVSKYTIVLLGPAVFLFMLVDREARHWFRRPHPYLAALLAFAVFSPVIIWNYENEWVSFLFQSQRRIADVFQFSTPQLLGAVLLLLTPTGVLAILAFNRHCFLERLQPSSLKPCHRHWLFALCMTLIPLTVFVVFSLTKEVKISWTGPLWLAFIPLMAAYLRGTGNGLDRTLPSAVSRMWPPTLACLVVGYGLALHYFSLGLPFVPFNTGTFLFGGSDLAGQIEQIVRKTESERGRPPVVIGMDRYRIASGLAYYRAKNLLNAVKNKPGQVLSETTGRHVFNMEALMYSYWQTPEKLAGRDLLVIAGNRAYLANGLFAGLVQDFGEVYPLKVKKHGKEAGEFFYRLLTDYNPQNVSNSRIGIHALSSADMHQSQASVNYHEGLL